MGGRERKRGEMKEIGVWKSIYNLMIFVGGGCEFMGWEFWFFLGDFVFLFLGLLFSLVFVGVKDVYVKVNFLFVICKLCMICLVGFFYMESVGF